MRDDMQRVLEYILKKLRDAENDRSNLYFNTKNCFDELKKKCELLHKNTDNSILRSIENYNIRHKETLYQIQKLQSSISNIFSLVFIGFVILALLILYKQ